MHRIARTGQVKVCLLSVVFAAALHVTYAIPTTETLEFETQALDLDTETVHTANVAEFPWGFGPGLLSRQPEADLIFGYDANGETPTLFLSNAESEVAVAFLADTPFETITSSSIEGLEFTTEPLDTAVGPTDAIVVRTDTGSHFKIGHVELATTTAPLKVTFDFERIDELYSHRQPVRHDKPVVTTARTLPAGLSADDFRKIQRLMLEASWKVRETDGVLEAVNGDRGLRAVFDSAGAKITPLIKPDAWWWELQATAVGRGATLATLEKVDPSAEGNQVIYRRSGIVEWYINDDRGLEHGFTLESPPEPAGDDPVTIALAATGTLGATPSDGSEILWTDAAGSEQLRYAGLMAWDSSGLTLPSRMVGSPGGVIIEVDDRGATYPVTVDPTILLESVELLPSDSQEVDHFGAIAVSADTVVIGAPLHNEAAEWSGAAYVFVRDGNSWIEEAKLTASDGGYRDTFGGVAIDGDTIAVGAASAWCREPKGIYVFVRQNGIWTEEAKLIGHDTVANDCFPGKMEVSGDTILASSPWDDDRGGNSGSAYVFVRSGGGWTQQAKLLANDGRMWHELGFEHGVGMSGDTIVLGARGDRDRGIKSGAAYVFVRNGGVWTQQAKLHASDGQYGDYFGTSADIDGDTLAVGAPYEDAAGGNAGAVYVFTRTGGLWTQRAKLVASDGFYRGRFGYSVAVSGELLVAGSNTGYGGADIGSAYVLRGSGPTWTEEMKLAPNDGGPGDVFGNSVAIHGPTIVVSGGLHDHGGVLDTGAAYVYDFTDTDSDKLIDQLDNCIERPNPSQSNIDGDTFGDLCDLCPSDPVDECDPAGSTAEEVDPATGGTITTPDDNMSIDIPPGALGENTTVSVTETVFNDPEADLALSTGSGLGQRLSVYVLEPDGVQFNSPVTITIVADVTSLTSQNQRDNLNLYLENAAGDLEPIPGAACVVVGDEATCTAEITHFSVYALVAPLDGDGDGIFDRFGGVEDICPSGPNLITGFLPPMTELVPDGGGDEVPLPDKAFKSNRTLPMKFDYDCGTVPVTDEDGVTAPELLGVWRVGEADPLPIIDPDSGESNDNGVWFRYSDEHWIYNLSTHGIPGGTYELSVRMPDGRAFRGGFVLR